MGKNAVMRTGGKSSDNPHRKAPGNGLRSKSTIQRLNMYTGGKPIRNKEGKIVGGKLMMENMAGGQRINGMARIAPDRRWFGNTRTISQTELDRFRDEMTTKQADPYSVVLRRKKIPMALLQDATKVASVNLLETESYEEVFGDKKRRKKPKFTETVSDYSALMSSSEEKKKLYSEEKDSNIEVEVGRGGDLRKDDMFSKGQSKRIWAELYKVLDCSDVVLQVVDARNVPGTRCFHVENHIKKHASHKQLVIIINKCDLVPAWVTRKWIGILSKDFPTLAFHASLTNAFGKGALISLLRQFGKLHSDKRQISVGVIGYPNTGKSSVINALMGTKCCRAAPVPGETKIWQYITLMKRIFLIDCPGIVYDTGDDEVETVLKGVVRAERLSEPSDFVAPILERVKAEYIQRRYGIASWEDHMDFLSKLALKNGKLMKGGEPDIKSVSVNMINDWQRGKLPFFVPPPKLDDGEGGENEEEGDESLDMLNVSAEENDDENDEEDAENDAADLEEGEEDVNEENEEKAATEVN